MIVKATLISVSGAKKMGGRLLGGGLSRKNTVVGKALMKVVKHMPTHHFHFHGTVDQLKTIPA